MSVFKRWEKLHNPRSGPGLASVANMYSGWIDYQDVKLLIMLARSISEYSKLDANSAEDSAKFESSWKLVLSDLAALEQSE